MKDTPDSVENVYFGGLNWDITPTLRLEGEYGVTERRYERETELVTDSRTQNDVWSVAVRNDITEGDTLIWEDGKQTIVKQGH